MTADRPLTYSEWMERKDSMTPAERAAEVEKARRKIRAEADAALRKPRKPAVRKPRRFPTSEEAAARPPERTKPTKMELRQERRRARLSPEHRALLEGIQDTIRRRADLELRPEPGVEPPEFPGTPEEREALRRALDETADRPIRTRADALREYRTEKRDSHARAVFGAPEEAVNDFEDLDAEPDEIDDEIARDLEDLI